MVVLAKGPGGVVAQVIGQVGETKGDKTSKGRETCPQTQLLAWWLENLEPSKECAGSGEPLVQMLLPEGPSEKYLWA